MPNWCTSAYVITGEAQEMDALHKIMSDLEKRKEPSVSNGFGTAWLGCLVDALGEDWHNVYCRGEWCELDYDGGAITFQTTTAWEPCNEVWKLVKRRFPSLEYYYQAEEPSMGYYITNDANGTYFPDCYHLSLCTLDGEYLEEYFPTLAQACHFIKEETGNVVETMDDIEKLNEAMNAANEDAYCYVDEFRIVE